MFEGLDLGAHRPTSYYFKKVGTYVAYAGVYLIRGSVLGISIATTFLYKKLDKLLVHLSGKKSGTGSEEEQVRHEVKEDQEVPPPKILSNSESESDRRGETSQNQQSTDDGQEVTNESNAA